MSKISVLGHLLLERYSQVIKRYKMNEISRNELDKASFQHGKAYEDFKD